MKRVLPILFAFILAFGIVTVAWVAQDASVKGIVITSSEDGVALQIRTPESEFTDDLSVGITGELTPCVYNGTFKNKAGIEVTSEDYVKKFYLIIQAEKNCTLTATKTVSGTLPVGVVIGQTEITKNTQFGVGSKIATSFEVCIYVDGEQYTGKGTAEVSITIHGAEL